MGEGNKSREGGREVGSRADFSCRAAACQAEGQQRAVANQFLIENEPAMTPGHCYLSGDAGAGCHQQLGSPNTQGIILPPAQLPRESHVQGITAPPASLQGRKAGRETSCCPATSQREQEVEEKDPVWIRCSETHGETTISSKLCICWSSAAALTSRGCALLDPYAILCNPSQDPTVGFEGPRQEKAPELKRFPGSYKPGCIILPAPGVPPSRDIHFISTTLPPPR